MEDKSVLCTLLGIECFKGSSSRVVKGVGKKKDELDSYESLVREAGKDYVIIDFDWIDKLC